MNNSPKSALKILFVCNLQHQINSGAHQRVSHLLKSLAALGEVTLIYPTKSGRIGADLAALSPLCKQVFTFPFESLVLEQDFRLPRPIFWLKHKLRYIHPTLPALMQQNRSAEGTTLAAQMCLQPFDLVWGQRLSSIQMLPAALTTRVIIDLDDLEHRSLRSRLRLGGFHHMTPLYWLEFLKLRRLELSLQAFPYEFSVCSEVDRKTLGGDSRVWVIPNGTDIPSRAPVPGSESAEPLLVFVGTMSYGPNVDGITCFHRQVLPLIRRRIPNVKLLIVGRDPAPEVRRLHNGDSVVVTGTVPDVAPYLHQAAVVLAPIRFGGGTRIKILEALAYRKAVVSTSLGAEGLEVECGKHLLIRDSPTTFADACILLLNDELLRRRLGETGFQLVLDRYQWTAIGRAIHGIVLGDKGAVSESQHRESASADSSFPKHRPTPRRHENY